MKLEIYPLKNPLRKVKSLTELARSLHSLKDPLNDSFENEALLAKKKVLFEKIRTEKCRSNGHQR